MNTILDRIIQGDCIDWLPKIPPESVHLFLSDIPYGIGLDDWDVFHNNTNSAYLGQSPAQQGKAVSKGEENQFKGGMLPTEILSKIIKSGVETGLSLFSLR